MKSSLVSTVLLLAVLGGRAASAAPAATKPAVVMDRSAVAAALFQEGIRDLEAGKTAEACDKLTESVATVPDSGAMGALAECDTTLGRLSEAWELWHKLASSAPTAELRDDAAKNAAALDQRLARVTIHLQGEPPADLAVTLNDKIVRTDDTTEHRVSPGAVVVVATSPDVERWSKTVDAKPGAKLDVEIRLVISRSASGRRHRGRVIGVSLLAVGVAAIGVGAVFGGLAYADWHSASTSCGGNTDRCASAGYNSAQDQLSSARTSATISSWSTVAGLGLAGFGLTLYLSFRDPARTESATAWRATPVAGPQLVGLTLTRSLP